MNLEIVTCNTAEPSDLSLLGIRVTKIDDESPIFKFEAGILWKSACYITYWDDGRMTVRYYEHLTAREAKTVYGLAEHYFHSGPDRSWRRLRAGKNRSVGGRTSHFYVRADKSDPISKMVLAAAGEAPLDRIEYVEAIAEPSAPEPQLI